MEDDSERVPLACADPADTVPQVDAIAAAGALDRAVANREDHAFALLERHHLGATLHAGALFGEDELAAGEVLLGIGQQEGDLQREDVFAVKVLMQTVEIVGAVFEQQRRRPGLSGGVASIHGDAGASAGCAYAARTASVSVRFSKMLRR